MKHQIPASVVKSYLDSIIQNSTALKSSLFRGGGLDVDPNSIPSVMPLTDLMGSGSADVNAGSDNSALNAQIALLQSQLNEKLKVISDLEVQNTSLSGEVKAKQERIEELEKLLAEAGSGGPSADPEMAAKLAEITKERDGLKEKLSQYAVIEDDLANVKRLKQENEQLRAALENAGGEVPASAPIDESVDEPEEALVDETPVAAAPEEEVPAEDEVPEGPSALSEEPLEAAPATEESSDDKSPEDLLSEFEKMLG